MGGAIWATKGALLIVGGPDLGDYLMAAVPLLAVGLLALAARARGGRLAGFGRALVFVALALGFVNGVHGVVAEATEFPFNVSYAVASLSLFVALLVLGVAAFRHRAVRPRWYPLAFGITALGPVWLLVLIHLELTMVALGLGWIALAVVIARSPTPAYARG